MSREATDDDLFYESCGDPIALAQESLQAGLIPKEVVDHLTSLHPQVPDSMRYRYLIQHLYDSITSDKQLFIRMVKVFNQYRSHPIGPGAASDASALEIEHISDLVELLVPHCYLWREIGTALRFQPQDLNAIQLDDSPKRRLIKLLEDWVQRCHKHTVPPTKNELKEALRSETVQLRKLVPELESHLFLKKKAIVNNPALPYFIVSMSVDSLKGSVSYSKNIHGLEAEESGSVLLEFQCHTEKSVGRNYQWYSNGEALVEREAGHTGTKTPFLCISNIDINMHGSKYSCTLTLDDEYDYSTEEVTLRVHSSLDQYTPSLVSMYSAKPEIPKDDWPPVSTTKHINLALIKQENIDYCADYVCSIRGDMDDILQDKNAIEYAEVVKDLRSKFVLFIEGRPGSGKTTLVHEITKDWAAKEDLYYSRTIRLLLLVSLRVLSNLDIKKIDLSDILNLFKDLKVNKEYLEDRNGYGVCFILDGLDEFSPPEGESSIVYKIIKKEYLSKSTVIVASRPAAAAQFRKWTDKVLEVLGFRDEQILEYFDHYPFSKKSKSQDLKAYLPTHVNVFHMCYLPIHCAMVAYLFQVTGKVPKTETEIYTHFTECFLKRGLERGLVDPKEPLKQISKLAFEKTKLNKQVLLQDEVKTYFLPKEKTVSLGLITVDRITELYDYKNMYTFLHLTFQEYLAARHISILDHREQYRLIQEYGDKNHMQVVWKFYCGLVKFDNENINFKEILKKTPGKTLLHTQCAYESQKSPVCAHQLLKSAKYSLAYSSVYLTAPDLNAIGYVMSKSVLSEKLAITNCSTNFTAEMLRPMLTQCSAKLVELDFSDNNIGNDGAKALASGLVGCGCLEVIKLSKNNVSVRGMRAIFGSIKQCKLRINCRDVIVGNKINSGQFTQILQMCPDLQSVKLLLEIDCEASKHWSCEEWKSLKSLQVTATRTNAGTFVDTALNVISRGLSTGLPELSTLILNNFNWDDEVARRFGHSLSACPNIKILNLNHSSYLTAAGIGFVAEHCHKLSELHLNHCEIDSEGAAVLSRYLSFYRNLHTLGIHSNRIGKTGAEALRKGITSMRPGQLRKFTYHGNKKVHD